MPHFFRRRVRIRARQAICLLSWRGYDSFLHTLKQQIKSSQVKAAVAVNAELIGLYWEIGKSIVERQESLGWGKSVVETLSRDLRKEFPDMKGFSPRNLWDMRRFYDTYRDRPDLRQLVAEIPWGHNLVLLNSLKDHTEREWYLQGTREYGWSRAILALQIENRLYHRQGKAANNFSRTLPHHARSLLSSAV